MIRFRRGRFHDLVNRQLDLFETDRRDLLDEATEADAAWTRAGRDDAEEAYGTWQLVADALAEGLLDLRETYAGTLDEAAADEYRGEFDRAAGRRFPRFTELLG